MFFNYDLVEGFLSAKFGEFRSYGVDDMKMKQGIMQFRIDEKMLDLLKEEYTYVLKRVAEDVELMGS